MNKGAKCWGGRRKSQEAFLLALNPQQGTARELVLAKTEVTIGSDGSNDLVVRGDSVSRRHARIRQHRGKWQILDNGSTNGTYVDDDKAVAWTTLRDGQQVRLGCVRFAFRSRKASGPGASGLPPRKRVFRLRTVVAVVVACLVTGFAATQYLLYRSDAMTVTSASSASSVSRHGKPNRTHQALAASPRHHGLRAATSPPWLEQVNHWRALAGVRPISSSSALDDAAEKHSRYLVKHALEGKLSELVAGGAHTEDPSDPWYTPAGLAAAEHSDVDPPCKGCPLLSPSQQVDDFLVVPFHRMSILDPQLRRIGYGSYTEAGLQASVLYTPLGADAKKLFKKSIEFPPNGSTVGFAASESEWPNPLTSCPGYGSPAGLPITLELGRWMSPTVSSHAVKVGTRTLKTCIFDASTYNNPNAGSQTRARRILKAYGAVVLIPRRPLTSDRVYHVSITADGTKYSWSFRVQ